MSTHVHKALGYAGKHPDRQRLEDRLHNGEKGEVAGLIADAYARLSESENFEMSFETPEAAQNIEASYPDRFCDIVKYADHPDSEDGVWVIMPPMQFKSWFRHGDIIDFYQNHGSEERFDTLLEWIDAPLHPYIQYVDAASGKRIVVNRPSFMLEKIHSPMQARKTPGAVPMPPQVVQIIAGHLGFDWKSLRPVLATWWC